MTDHSERLRMLGWTDVRFGQFQEHFSRGLSAARVVAIQRGVCIIDDGTGERRAKPSGRLQHSESELPTVGDWVAVQGMPNEHSTAVIHAIAPRTSALLRKEPGRRVRAQVLAANVDLVLLAAAANAINARRLERGIALAWDSGAEPIVVLTKIDLCADAGEPLRALQARLTGVDVIALSSVSGYGVAQCAERVLPRSTAALLGPSGVGKSTLLNALTGEERMRTAVVRPDGKGRHTTTHRQLWRLPSGGLLIDTPGLRELQLWGEEESVDATFGNVRDLAQSCRFADCAHESEPGCAVLEAVEQGRLDVGRLAHWRQLRAELAYLEQRDDKLAAVARKRQDAIGARLGRARIREKYC